VEPITEHAGQTVLEALIDSWELSLRQRNLSAQTQKTYLTSAGQLLAHLAASGITDPEAVRRIDIQTFLVDLLVTRSPATASVRFRALQQLFGWMTEEGEIDTNPMERMKPPIVPEQPVPVVEMAAVLALMKTCEGKDYASRRDAAIVAVFIDTGARLSEVAALMLDDVDLRRGQITVIGKGRAARTLSIGVTTAARLDRYQRTRARHRLTAESALWLAERGGGMTSSGIARVIRRRGKAAGIAGLHPHQLRHTTVHQWLAAGGLKGDAMEMFGWRSRQMLSRYGKSAAAERSRSAHRRHGLGRVC